MKQLETKMKEQDNKLFKKHKEKKIFIKITMMMFLMEAWINQRQIKI